VLTHEGLGTRPGIPSFLWLRLQPHAFAQLCSERQAMFFAEPFYGHLQDWARGKRSALAAPGQTAPAGLTKAQWQILPWL